MLFRHNHFRTYLALILLSTALLLSACLEEPTTEPGSPDDPDNGDRKPALSAPQNNCPENTVRLKKADQSDQILPSLQEAINQASVGDKIFVGSGTYLGINEVTSKTKLEILSECHATVQGFRISSSHEVTINGFIIDAKNSGADGLWLAPGSLHNSDIIISFNEIENASNLFSGISVGDENSNIRIATNYIHDNLQNGIYFDGKGDAPGSSKGGPYFLIQNRITANSQNGIYIDGKQELTLDRNDIIANGGTRTPHLEGYGLKVANAENSDYITLTANTIAYNNGKVSPNKSTKDIYGVKKIFDSGDTGNQTSGGGEGSGVTTFVDTEAPVISLGFPDLYYTNKSNFQIPVEIDDLSPITTKVRENNSQIYTTTRFIFTVPAVLREGTNTFDFKTTDAAGNVGTAQLAQIILDTVKPVIQISAVDNVLTNQPLFNIPVHITDTSPIVVKLIHNGVEINQSADPNVNFNINLTEGLNTIEIQCVDAAGNIGDSKKLNNITLDTVPPALSNMFPAANDFVIGLNFAVSGNSNESLQSIKVNGFDVSLGQDKKSFTAMYTTPGGPLTLNWEAVDLAGNVTNLSIPVQVTTKVLISQLISVEPDPKAQDKLIIRGARGSSKGGLTISAKSSFFSRSSTVSNPDGSFTIPMSFFTQATLSADNPFTGEVETASVQFGPAAGTFLSGSVKDTNDHPLAGATVSIAGAGIFVTTDADGIFIFTKPVVGDQTLTIDGSTVIPSVSGSERKFSKTRVAINIGYNQSNVLQRPIYLAPIPMDGSSPVIEAASGGTVTSANAPGVEITIPAGKVVFPNGQDSSEVSMAVIPAEFSTVVPLNFAKPKTVIALEPSGVQFKEPVELVLPNYNNLPAGVEMVVMSMNSTKGIWEIDGAAKVSQDGRSVVTKPGMGITHFSMVYASPIGPTVRTIGSQDQPGADTFNGALTTAINLPSYKSLGQDVTPSLIYRSSWAKPTTVVTNLFDIPKSEVTLDYNTVGIFPVVTKYKTQKCDFFSCWEADADYYDEVNYRSNTRGTAWYEPDHITAQFSTLNILSEPVTFKGMPNRASVSYSIDLKDPATGKYIGSGVYPYNSHYEIFLNQISVGTRTTTFWSPTLPPQTRQDNFRETRLIEQAFPSDLGGTIYVQNETNSVAGRGWKIAGIQKIVNPNSNRIMIEEADGTVAGYAIANTISTLYEASSTAVDLEEGVDLTQWPKAIVTSYTNPSTDLVSIDLSSGAQSSLGNLINYTGSLFQDDGYTFLRRSVSYRSTGHAPPPPPPGPFGQVNDSYLFAVDWSAWNRHTHPYQTRSKTTQVVQAPDGQVFGVDNLNHRLFSLNQGTYTHLAGARVYPLYTYDFGYSQQGLLNYCASNFGQACDSYSTTSCEYIASSPSGSPVYYNNCGTIAIIPSLAQQLPMLAGGSAAYTGEGAGSSSGLNAPTGIVIAPDGRLVIADMGNNRVRVYDLATGNIDTLAGNGQSFDSGDGGSAREASMYHPRGLVYDQFGNLYVSTERGYIRKVDTAGNISTVAGLPIDLGGELKNEGQASEMALNRPYGMALDSAGNTLFVADTGNNRVLQLDLNTHFMKTAAGNGTCLQGEDGDGGAALNASLCSPTHVGFDNTKNLVVVDSGHSKIRRVLFQNTVQSTIAFSPAASDLSTLTKNQDGTWTRTFRNGHKIFFDINGRQVATQNRVGNSLNYEYDADGKLLRITDAVGQITQYNYSGNKLLSIKDPADRVTNFEYSGDNLNRVLFPDGTAKSYQYNSDGLMISETNERGYPTQYTYNQWNRLETVIRADNTQIAVNDSASGTVGNNYTGANVGQLKSYGTDSDQIFDGIKDARSMQTKYVKDYKGYITTIEDAKGQVTKIQRNSIGQPTLITRPDNTTVIYTYNPNTHDLLSTSDSATGITTSATYDAFGNTLTQTNGRGFTATTQYDSNTSLPLQIDYAGGGRTLASYTASGLPQSSTQVVSSNNSLTTTNIYDSRGNLISATDPSGRTTTRVYDAAGNVIKIINKKDANTTITTQYAYDVRNHLTSVTTPDAKTTFYTYLPTGDLGTINDPLGNVTTFTYDKLGRILKKKDALGNETLLTYDNNGNVIQKIDPNGNVAQLQYDNLDRLTLKTLPDNIYQYAYDPRGNLTQTKNNTSELDFGYDVANRLTSATSFGLGTYAALPSLTITYGYDENSNRTSMASSLGITGYLYDARDRLIQLTNHKNEVFNFGYDNINRLTNISRPGSQSSFNFDNANFVSSIIHSSNNTPISSFVYAHDDLGNRTQIRTLAGDNNYSYDLNSQLTSVSHPVASHPTLPQENYTYDVLGNRLTDQNGNYIYDAKSQKLNEDYRYVYLYDNNGNLLKRIPKITTEEAWEYNYSSEDQLISIKVYNGMTGPLTFGPLVKTIFYTYDAAGRRVQKVASDTRAPGDVTKNFTRRYVYDTAEILAEYDGANHILAKYTHSHLRTDDVLAVDITANGVGQKLAQSSGTHMYLKDALGTITEIASTSGGVVQKYQYSSYGQLVAITDGAGSDVLANPILNTAYSFTGRERDQESGMYFYRARYYDSSVGRFLQQDPYPGQANMPTTVNNHHTYVTNNPVNFGDPTGKFLGRLVSDLTNGLNSAIDHLFGGKSLLLGIIAEFAHVIPVTGWGFINFSGTVSTNDQMVFNKVTAIAGLVALGVGHGYCLADYTVPAIYAGTMSAIQPGDVFENFLENALDGAALTYALGPGGFDANTSWFPVWFQRTVTGVRIYAVTSAVCKNRESISQRYSIQLPSWCPQ